MYLLCGSIPIVHVIGVDGSLPHFPLGRGRGGRGPVPDGLFEGGNVGRAPLPGFERPLRCSTGGMGAERAYDRRRAVMKTGLKETMME